MFKIDRTTTGTNPSLESSPEQSSSERTARPRSSHTVPGALQGLADLPAGFRNKVYRMRKERFVQALNSNSVGRELLKDPHVVNARLINDPSQPPVYQGNPENQFEGTINMRSLNSFPSTAEHHATFTHEALHKMHQTHDPAEFKRRQGANGTHSGWSNAEEQLTITGKDPTLSRPEQPDHLSENVARRELGLKERHSHLPANEDPHRDMTAAEYRTWRGQTGGSSAIVIGGDSDRPLKKRPILSSSNRPKKPSTDKET